LSIKTLKEKNGAFNNLEDVFKGIREPEAPRHPAPHRRKKKPLLHRHPLTTKLPDSPTLSYHLRDLAPFFLTQKNGKYELITMGKDAYNLLQKTSATAKSSCYRAYLLSHSSFDVFNGFRMSRTRLVRAAA
jgi:hypothetical protein